MTSSWFRGVAVLGCTVALACGASASDDDDDDDGSSTGSASSDATMTGSSTTNDPSATSTGPTTSATQTVSTSDDASTDEGSTGSTTTTGDTSTDGSTEAGDASTGSTGDTPNQACIDGCMVELACQATCECDTMWRSEQSCVAWCDANLEKAALFSPFCRDAWEALSACFATLTCEEFHAYHNPTMLPYPCSTEAESLAFECEGQ